MSEVDRIYKQHFRKNFANYEANFPASNPIELGDYGVVKNGYFERYGNIRDKELFGIDFKTIPDDYSSYETFKSEGSVGITSNAKGDIGISGVPLIKARIDFTFSADKSLFFSSAGVKYIHMDNLVNIGNSLIELYKQNKWKKKYVLVTSIIEAQTTLILISGSSQCNVTVEAKSDVIKEIDLMDVNTEIGVKSFSNVSYHIIAPHCNVGFSLSRVYNPLFVGPEFKNAKYSTNVFASLDYNKEADAKGLVFGNILPGSYDV